MDYKYFGYTKDKQLVQGRISAGGEQAAIEMLDNVGYRVVSLQPITNFLPDMSGLLRGRVNPSELSTFSRQLALLLESGVGIVQCFELLQDQTTNSEFKKVLNSIIVNLRQGRSLASALANHPHVFSGIYSKMIAVGEQTGSLEGVLRSLADFIEHQSEAVNKLKRALTYPAIVLLLGIGVAALLILVVLPPIVSMFKSLGGDLPLPTRLLLSSVDLLNNYGLYILVAVAGLGFLGFLYSRTSNGRYLRDVLFLKLPVIGRIILLSELSRCCQNLAILYKSGLILTDVMTMTAQACGNLVIANALREVEQDMLQGEGLAKPMGKKPVFPPLMAEMARVGEETGNLDAVMLTVAQNYEIEADRRIQTLISMIEPAMTIAMGLGVGFLALSIFLPIYSSLSLVG